MICKKCGRELPEDAKFCGVCGTPVATLSDYTARSEPAGQQAFAQPEQAAPEQNTSTRQAPPAPVYNAPQTGYSAPRTTRPAYDAAAYAPAGAPASSTPLTTGQYLVMDLLMAVPIANIVMLIVWGFGDAVNPNRKNWARSRLVWLGIGLGITIVVLAVALLATN